MAKKIDKGVFLTDTQPSIISSAAIVGGKEGKGPLGKHFDKIVDDSHFGEKTWEMRRLLTFRVVGIGIACVYLHQVVRGRHDHRARDVDRLVCVFT